MISGRTIAKNVSVMMASQLTTWALSFVLAIFLPRYLGADLTGVVAIATSIWLMGQVFISFGMDTHLTKSVARDPTLTVDLMLTSLLIRSLLFVLTSGVVALYSWIMGYDATANWVLVIEGICFLFLAYSGAFSAVLVGLERMEFISIANIASKVILTGGSLLLIMLDAGLYLVISVNIIAAIVLCVILLWAIQRLYPLRLQFRFAGIPTMFAQSWVYLISAFAMTVYQQIDKLFIAALVDTRTVGWYSTAMNLFGTMMFLPVVFGTVIFPSMARSYASGDSKLNLIAQRSFDLMFMLSVPVGLGLVVIGQPFVDLLYGPEFYQSGIILMLLGVVLIFTYLNTILGQLLISVDRTGSWNIVMFVAIAVTLPLDLWLVPWTHATYQNGALGGVLGFLITECGMVVTAIFLLPRNTLGWSNVRSSVLTLCAGLLMMATSWWLRTDWMLLSIIVAAITYVGAVLALRIIPRQEMEIIRHGIMSILGRLRRN